MHIISGLKNVFSLNPNGARGIMQLTYSFAKFKHPHRPLDIICTIQYCYEDGNVSVCTHPHQPPRLLVSLCFSILYIRVVNEGGSQRVKSRLFKVDDNRPECRQEVYCTRIRV
jgi:hypothetical protein